MKKNSSRKARAPPAASDPKKNWDSNSPDGLLLKMLVESGNVKGMTTKAVMNSYPQLSLENYKYATINSALTNARRVFQNQLQAQHDDVTSEFTKLYNYKLFFIYHNL